MSVVQICIQLTIFSLAPPQMRKFYASKINDLMLRMHTKDTKIMAFGMFT